MIGLVETVRDDREYDDVLQQVQQHFMAAIAGNKPLFTVEFPNLYGVFISGLPDHMRQHHTCRACERFVNAFGGLVTIEDDGSLRSALWSRAFENVSPLYQVPIEMIRRFVERSRVTGVFISDKEQLGTPVTGEWHHFAVALPADRLWGGLTKTAAQVMAEKHEDYGTLQRALAEYSLETLQKAATLLKTDSLYRSEKVLGVAEWLIDLHTQRKKTDGNRRDNLTWRAVATAPAGYCHPRSSMIGTLLDDLAMGLSYDTVARRFASKMHPLQYQRPQAAPVAGNIAQAEKVIEQLNAAGALARRFAQLEDIQTLWQRVVPQSQANGIFGHLKTKQTPRQMMHVTKQTMTWEKFRRTVMPEADHIEYYVSGGRDGFAAFVTAANPDAPLIFQWDNPVSWYVYSGGSPASQWGLRAGWVNVNGVALQPSAWSGTDKYAHLGMHVMFILEGAKDSRSSGAGIFPEILRSEFHPIRATIEAYSQSATIAGRNEASACGVMLGKGGAWSARFRVTSSSGVVAEYVLDRWD